MTFALLRGLRFNQDMRFLVAAVVVLWSAQASAETIYKYRDKDTGRDVYVNRLDRIPLQYRSQAKIAVESSAKPEKRDSEPMPVAEPAPRPPVPATAVDQARTVGADLQRAMAGRNLWKNGAAIACAAIDARLTREGAPPLTSLERNEFDKFLTTTVTLSIIGTLLAFLVWVVMIVSAIRDGQRWWALLIFLFCPLAYVYLFRHAGKGRRAFTLACTAGLLFPALVGLAGAWRFHAWFQAVVTARGGHL